MMDPGIICFRHCGPNIFCKTLPEKCPICSHDLSITAFGLLPFRVPYPFVKASQYSCAVLIKPTTGDFLNDYFNSKDLHIGVTTSSCHIVEFDKRGLQKNKQHWEQCLMVGQMGPSWAEHWDEVLKRVSEESHWTSDDYREDTYNCYTFVLRFLQEVKCGELSAAAASRTAFCDKFIVPRTTAAGKYISLYRRLKNKDVYVHWDDAKNKQCK